MSEKQHRIEKASDRESDLRVAFQRYLTAEETEGAYSCMEILYRDYGDRQSVLEFRNQVTHIDNPSELDLEYYRASYDLCARDYFDDFMLSLEWDRSVESKFWLPRRQKLIHICEHLQALEDGELDELFLSMPPRTGKSTIVQFFALWTMLRHPELSSLYATYTDTVAKVFYTGLLEILNDPYTYRWQEIFPERSLASTDAKDLLLNIDKKKRYASFTARSLWGSLNGAINASNYLIGDDLISGIEEAMSTDRLNTAWRTVQNNYLARNADGKAKILWIGTRWSLQDPIARRIDTLESDPEFASVRYEVVNTPALNDNDESNFEYAFGKGFSTSYFKQIRASFERNNDIVSWDSQYQGTPYERSGSVFVPDDLRYYNGTLPSDTEADRIFVVVDPAWGGGDRCAAVAVHQYGSDLYVDEVVFNSGDKKLTQPMVASMAKNHGATAMFIEATKATSGYAEGVDRLLGEYEYRLNLQTTTKHWSGQRGKQQRIFDRSPDIRENMIFRDANSRDKEYQKFMENIFEFKVLGKNKQGDDAPDVCAMAIVFAFLGETKAVIMKRPY